MFFHAPLDPTLSTPLSRFSRGVSYRGIFTIDGLPTSLSWRTFAWYSADVVYIVFYPQVNQRASGVRHKDRLSLYNYVGELAGFRRQRKWFDAPNSRSLIVKGTS